MDSMVSSSHVDNDHDQLEEAENIIAIFAQILTPAIKQKLKTIFIKMLINN